MEWIATGTLQSHFGVSNVSVLDLELGVDTLNFAIKRWKVRRGIFASGAAQDMFPFASEEIARQCLRFKPLDGPGLA